MSQPHTKGISKSTFGTETLSQVQLLAIRYWHLEMQKETKMMFPIEDMLEGKMLLAQPAYSGSFIDDIFG